MKQLRQELRKSGPSIENAVKWKEARTRMKRIFRMYRNLEKKNLFKKLQDKFRQNPFTAIKEELQKEDPQPPSLDIPEEKIIEHFKNNYCDNEKKKTDFTHPSFLPKSDYKTMDDIQFPSFEQFGILLSKKKNKCAPGPNCIPYVVWKKVPYVVWKKVPTFMEALYKVLKRIFELKAYPDSWGLAFVTMLPKPNSDGKDISKTRPIAVGNCDGKIFNTVIQEAVANHTLSKFNFQKGFRKGVSGCIEHATITSEIFKEVKALRKNLTIVWVDLADAFGSVKHQLIFFALKYFGIHERIIGFYKRYYSSMRVQIRVGEGLTPTIPFEVGVFQGCVSSPTLFNLVFQLLLFSLAVHQQEAYEFNNKSLQLLVAAFADDLQLTTSSKAGAKLLIKSLEQFLSWSRGMKAKPQKCIAHSFVQGKPANPDLKINNVPITNLQEAGEFKYLGRWFEPNAKEQKLRERLTTFTRNFLKKVDAMPLYGSQKAWSVQHLLLSRLTWSLMIHDLSLPFAKKMDKIIKPFLKKWWGFVRSANTVILFTGSKNTVGLRHKRVETLYKQAQSIKLDILRSSQDSDMHGVYNVIMEKSSNWSKKFSASAEWERLIKFFSYRSLAKQSAGLGHRLRDLRTTRPDLLKRFEVEATDELLNSLNKLQVQGQWKEWSKCMINDFTWNKVLREGNPAYISFQLKAVTNTLPSQDNLKRWNITNVDQNCVLCGKVNPTLRHVLTGCPVSLTQGRFTWRHDSVLKRIVIFLEELIIKANKRKENLPPPSQTFLKTGENKPLERISKETGELSLANDWVILDDVGDNRLIVPLEVCHVSSSLRPDIFIYSFFAKRALILELTCPNEDRFETSHVLKEKKYLKLRDSIIANGFDCNIFTIEVGVRGNICMDQLNIWTRHIGSPLAPTKALFCECTRIARQCPWSATIIVALWAC